MVTPTYATLTFKGLNTNKTYSVDAYISDVVAAAVTFDSGSGAGTGSLNFWKCPEDVMLVDLAVVTGPTVMTNLIVTADGGVVAAQRLRISIYLNTLATRPPLSLAFRRGSNFGMTQA